ncbi:uncharacterized protein N7503_009134 [Penicillium pulvis]|uniref:uncharacterized protein n=1 Tax=Penicillium pulvis TaxID=1562058 RepID=UPI00254659EC|nr:uncharacterized protein N7503_009134 [Penicillium pulvis]KAJ5793156.1 hypothetical protein N7503_009134 [Penicillium pulvis]
MVQRGKVLEIEGPTPKFLYAMLKQLDLKNIDWNRVATEQAISNGHAARMRFSRFRNQMEGKTGAQRPGRKRNSKKADNVNKGEKGDPKAMVFEMQIPPHPIPGPSMESGESFQYINSVKFEGDQRVPFSDIGELYPWSQGSPTSITNYPTPQINPFMLHEMQHGLSYPGIPSGFPSGFPSMSSNSQWFYSPIGMPLDSTMQDLPISLPDCNYNPVATWESTVMNQPEVPPVKTEEDVQLVEVKNEPDIPIKVGMSQDIAFQELTTSLPSFSYNPAVSWESTTVNQSETTRAGVDVEGDVQLVQVKTEPDVPVKVETYQIV